MGVRTLQAKAILQRSRLPDARFVINPYIGCVHGCVYCYARFMKRFTAHREPWGAFVDAKLNAADLLRQELARRREPITDVVFLSSVTDPYQPAERKCRLTRALLEVLLEYQVPVSVLTKSDLVLRDIDLLERFASCRVGLSISILDAALARRLEPRAVPPARRLRALRTLRDRGVRTYAFVSPCLPGITQLDGLVEALSGTIDEIGFEAINPHGGNWRGVEQALSEPHPELLTSCRNSAKDPGVWAKMEAEAGELAARYGIADMGFFRH